jgi:soluble lytic murein transglycosylase-like protein
VIRNDEAAKTHEFADRRARGLGVHPRDQSEPRTIVIRQGSSWQSLAFLCLSLLLLAAVMLGHQTLRNLDGQSQSASAAMARVERKMQQLESGLAFDSKRRYLLLGMRNHIMKTNPRVSLRDAYRYAELALEASEKYPAVDPLLLLAIGIVESRYDPQAKSPADARGLYQIWPSTGRLLMRSLGWTYDETTLYDPEKNTQAAALYLDILFSAYGDPQLVLAEYNGGPLNAGYFRAGVAALAAETRSYVPKVLDLYSRLRQEFDQGFELQLETMHRDAQREGKTLVPARAALGNAPPASGRERGGKESAKEAAPAAPNPRPSGRQAGR